MTERSPAVNEAAENARQYRVRLGLGMRGPIPDLLHLVEDGAGMAVSVLDLPAGVSGAYAYEEGQGFAFVNLNDPVVRQRFTLAHELAHYVHKDTAVIDSESNIFGSPREPRERRANVFAAEFLVPLQAVTAWMEARALPPVNLRLVVEMASFFRVSAKVALIRLQLARFIDAQGQQNKSLEASIEAGEHRQLARRHGIVEAPDALSQIKQRGSARAPGKMWEFAVQGYERGLLTVERIAQAIHKSPADVQTELDELGIMPPADEPDF